MCYAYKPISDDRFQMAVAWRMLKQYDRDVWSCDVDLRKRFEQEPINTHIEATATVQLQCLPPSGLPDPQVSVRHPDFNLFTYISPLCFTPFVLIHPINAGNYLHTAWNVGKVIYHLSRFMKKLFTVIR